MSRLTLAPLALTFTCSLACGGSATEPGPTADPGLHVTASLPSGLSAERFELRAVEVIDPSSSCADRLGPAGAVAEASCLLEPPATGAPQPFLPIAVDRYESLDVMVYALGPFDGSGARVLAAACQRIQPAGAQGVRVSLALDPRSDVPDRPDISETQRPTCSKP